MSRYCAVLVCNVSYVPKASFVAQQLVDISGGAYDVVICSDAAPDDPAVSVPPGVILSPLDGAGALKDLPQNARLKHYTYWRLPAVQALAQCYDRILYLDTDIFVTGDSILPLFDLDLQGAGLAAVRDVHQRHRPDRMPREFDLMGWPVAPYFNAGVLVIDGPAWLRDGRYDQIMTLARTRPDVLVCHDQSLLNLVFYQDWLELAPTWNWQQSYRMNWIAGFARPALLHFAGATKIWDQPDGSVPDKYHNAYARFSGTAMVKRLPIADRIRQGLGSLFKNLWYARRSLMYLRRFPSAVTTYRHQKP